MFVKIQAVPKRPCSPPGQRVYPPSAPPRLHQDAELRLGCCFCLSDYRDTRAASL